DALLSAAADEGGHLLLGGSGRWPLAGSSLPKNLRILAAPLGMPDADERQRAWATALDQERIDIAPAAVWILADRFRLTGSQIAEAAATASGVAAWRRGVTSAIETASLENGQDTNEVTLDDLFAAARL